MRSSAGPGGQPPKVVIMPPPIIKETAQAQSWGFVGSAAKSLDTARAFREVAEKHKIPYVNLQDHAIAEVGADGVHFPAACAESIARAVEVFVRIALRGE